MSRLPILAALPFLLSSCGPRKAHETFPGAPVVLISIDTLRADHLPAYGYRGVETPAIDRLRRDSVLFRRAYSPCPMTLPSHVTMLTGLLPPEHGVRNNAGFRIDARRHPGLPALLRARGYRLGAAVSSWVLRAETGLSAYFDAYDDAIDAPPGAAFAEHQRPGAVTAAAARAWIEAQGERPWFFFLHLYEPHVPYDPPEPFHSRYAKAPYDGEIAAVDAVVGEVLDWLRSRGQYDRAIVALTSDHGEGLGDHGEQQHSVLLYREALEVPLILKLPGGTRGGTAVDAPVQLADLAPTLAELTGAGPLRPAAGVSLLAFPQGVRALYAETLYPRLQLGWSDLRSVIEERYHYVDSPRPELFDLVADPAERSDLAAKEPAVAERLRARLAAFPRGAARPEAVDPATAERLGALGYVGTPRERSGPLPNPRDQIASLDRLGEALRLAAARRDAEALAALKRLLAEQPGLVEAWIAAGDVLARMTRYDEAVAAYSEALGRAPLPDVMLARGSAHLQAARLAEAEADAVRAAADAPARAAELRARVAMAAGRRDDAESIARAALEAQRPSTRVFLAEMQARRGALAAALATLDEAERQATQLRLPKLHRLDFVRADVLARLSRPAEAEAAYRREIDAFPDDLQAYANLAVLRFVQGRRADALATLEAMTRANPNPASRELAARTRAALGIR